MENKLDCAVVRDLLPSYADGLTSDETNAALEEHIKGCESCSAALRRMREPEKTEAAPESDVDYLKKVRSRSTRRSLAIAIVLMLIGVAMLLFRVYYVGSGYDAYGAIRSVTVDGPSVALSGTLSDRHRAVARVTFSDSNGIVQAHVYTAPKTFFNSGDFAAEYTAASDVSQVRMGAYIAWENGVEISPIASELFDATNPFVGDMPANANIAFILGVGDQLGPYTNELQTTVEPYGWTLILENPISREDEAAARSIMAADSYAMMAVIENLGSVTWRYQSAEGEKELTISEADASRFAGKDIKLCGSSAAELQALMQTLGIKRSGIREIFHNSDDGFKLAILNECDDKIYGATANYKLNGKAIGTQGMVNAKGTPIAKGDSITFEFLSKDFSDDITAITLTGFSFDLSVLDADGNETLVCKDVKVPARYTWTYLYTLSGSADAGYVLSEG